MIVLDTNVVSELIRASPDPGVVGWVDRLAVADTYITAITAAELLHGVALLAPGRRRTRLAAVVEGLIDEDFSERVLAFDIVAAAHFAEIVSGRSREGRPISHADAQIAAVCRSRGATIATRNVRDFDGTGVTVVDPWIEGS